MTDRDLFYKNNLKEMHQVDIHAKSLAAEAFIMHLCYSATSNFIKATKNYGGCKVTKCEEVQVGGIYVKGTGIFLKRF